MTNTNDPHLLETKLKLMGWEVVDHSVEINIVDPSHNNILISTCMDLTLTLPDAPNITHNEVILALLDSNPNYGKAED